MRSRAYRLDYMIDENKLKDELWTKTYLNVRELKYFLKPKINVKNYIFEVKNWIKISKQETQTKFEYVRNKINKWELSENLIFVS
jgi:hypothetical protein